MSRIIIIDDGAGPKVSIDSAPPEAASIIELLRMFEATTLRVWYDNALGISGRQALLQALINEARSSVVPDLALRAIERATNLYFGNAPNPWERAALEESVIRDLAKGRLSNRAVGRGAAVSGGVQAPPSPVELPGDSSGR